jgi:hypothetical protein
MQEVELAGQADPAGAAVPERLHAGDRDPERVRVVAMERERGAAEARLHPLDSRRAPADPDRVAGARTFKTAGPGRG